MQLHPIFSPSLKHLFIPHWTELTTLSGPCCKSQSYSFHVHHHSASYSSGAYVCVGWDQGEFLSLCCWIFCPTYLFGKVCHPHQGLPCLKARLGELHHHQCRGSSSVQLMIWRSARWWSCWRSIDGWWRMWGWLAWGGIWRRMYIMMDNKPIESALVMEYVWDEMPVSCMHPSRFYPPYAQQRRMQESWLAWFITSDFSVEWKWITCEISKPFYVSFSIGYYKSTVWESVSFIWFGIKCVIEKNKI